MENPIFKYGVYKHSKTGNLYHMYDCQLDSERIDSVRVSYQGLYGDKIRFNRPAVMFDQTVIINDIEMKRFEYLKTWNEYLSEQPTPNEIG